ncbi:hypothetical protein ABZ897_53020 [Nonomuraea sp. NPDC046802]
MRPIVAEKEDGAADDDAVRRPRALVGDLVAQRRRRPRGYTRVPLTINAY